MFYNDNYLSPKQKSLVQNYIHQVLIKNIEILSLWASLLLVKIL